MDLLLLRHVVICCCNDSPELEVEVPQVTSEAVRGSPTDPWKVAGHLGSRGGLECGGDLVGGREGGLRFECWGVFSFSIGVWEGRAVL